MRANARWMCWWLFICYSSQTGRLAVARLDTVQYITVGSQPSSSRMVLLLLHMVSAPVWAVDLRSVVWRCRIVDSLTCVALSQGCKTKEKSCVHLEPTVTNNVLVRNSLCWQNILFQKVAFEWRSDPTHHASSTNKQHECQVCTTPANLPSASHQRAT